MTDLDSLPDVSVIIPTRNRRVPLERCLNSLINQTFERHEIIVINNGSTDGTKELLAKYPVKVIDNDTRNLPHLYNVGCAASQGNVLVFINDDAEAVPSWLENLMRVLSGFSEAGAVGGPTIATREQEIFSFIKNSESSFPLGFLVRIYDSVVCHGELLSVGSGFDSGAFGIGGSLTASTQLPAPIKAQLLSITNMAVRKELYRRIGGFDENFRFSGYDSHFLSRVRALGYQLIFDPRAVVYHHVDPSGLTRSPRVLARDTAYWWMKSAFRIPFQEKGRLALNIVFYNGFWLYKTVTTGRTTFLQGLSGFAEGIRDYFANPQRKSA